MNGIKSIVAAVIMAFALSGCVLVISDEGFSTSDSVHARDRSSSQDRALAARVNDAYAAEPTLRNVEITVSAHDGVITLRGELDRVADLERAVNLAKGTEGVEKVISRLRLELR